MDTIGLEPLEVILVLPSASQFDMQLSDLAAERSGAGFGAFGDVACREEIFAQCRVVLLVGANERTEAVDLRLELAVVGS